MNDFGLWHVRMKDLLEHQGLAAALEELPIAIIVAYDNVIQEKAYITLILCMSQSKYIDEFHKLVGDLAAIYTAISDEDQALLLLTSLSSSYDNFVKTLLYGRDTLKLEDVLMTINSRELQNMTKAKGDGGEGLYNHKKSQGFVRNEDQVSGFRANEYDSAEVMMAMSGIPCMGDRYSSSTDEGWVKFRIGQRQSGKIKIIRGSLVVLSGIRRADCVYTLDGQAVNIKTLKGRKQLREYHTRWKIKTGNLFDFCNQRSTQQYPKSGVTKHLGVALIQQQNRLVKETNVTLLAKVRCFLIQSGLSNVLWAEDTTMSTYLVNKVLQEVEFEVEPHEDHIFKVEPHGNVDHVVGSQEVQTQDLIYYHSPSDREQHSAFELFSYREDSNEAAFVVAAVDKIYAHESLTFDNTVACEEYQMVCTRLDIASVDVGMLDKFDRGLQTDV
ncbi:hypothetical protein Tco_0861679 [Tanacetum coccineum]|uniref:Zinc finger, CCHC-type n=1 Tax=Tanacetum coccineum TaxID=301880 RepID=A0ABQ5BLG8_9ASTR